MVQSVPTCDRAGEQAPCHADKRLPRVFRVQLTVDSAGSVHGDPILIKRVCRPARDASSGIFGQAAGLHRPKQLGIEVCTLSQTC